MGTIVTPYRIKNYPQLIPLCEILMSDAPSTRSILITGCSTGIGHCVAVALQQRGYRVFATARKAEDVEALKAGGLTDALQLDLDDSASIQAAVSEVLQRCDGRLYALFNNGGFGQPGAIEDLDRETLRGQFETLVFGWTELTNAVLPSMRQHNEGRIIQNGSVLGLVALPFRGAYNGAKYAIEGMADTLRLELHDTGIQISLIEPGPIMSQFRANSMRKFEATINVQSSPFKSQYEGMLARLKKKGPAAPFTLPPEAVLKRVIHALESRRAQPRYYVTVPTYVFGFLRRFLSTRAMDRLLLRVSSDELQRHKH